MRLVSDGKEIVCGTDEGIRFLNSGQAALAIDFVDPPVDFAEYLSERFNDPNLLGPSSVELGAFRKLSSVLVESGRRQGFLERGAVNWMNRRELRQTLRMLVFGDAKDSQCFLEPLEAIWAGKSARNPNIRSSPVALSVEEQNDKGWILHRKGKPIPKDLQPYDEDKLVRQTWLYKPFDPLWYRFGTLVSNFDARLRETEFEALRTGRILCVEEQAGGDRLILPNEIGDRLRKKGIFWFCFAGPLPLAHFVGKKGLADIRHAVSSWISRTGTYLHSVGKRATKEQFRLAAQWRFGSTDTAFEMAWKHRLADFPNKGGKGSLKYGLEVSLNEIIRLGNNES